MGEAVNDNRQRLTRLVGLGTLPLLLALGLVLAGPAPADAATIVVTSTGAEQTTNGLCTLVEALNNANNNALSHPDCLVAGQGGAVIDTVTFNIPNGQCVVNECTIFTGAPYRIVGPVTIDGYTQPGASPNTLAVGSNAVLRIVVRPQTAAVTSAFRVEADDVTLRGLSIGGYADYGVTIVSGARAKIVGCFIGTDAAGNVARSNGDAGVYVGSSASVVQATIGGTAVADRNVISGNTIGIYLVQALSAVIQNNYIGLKANGLESLPNAIGIDAFAGLTHQIGGTTVAARNVISGNTGPAIILNSSVGTLVTQHVVEGNFIGPRADGVVGSTGNGQGIDFRTSGNTIGGTVAGAGNRIIGNTGFNVATESQNARGNAILGNSIAGSSGLGIDLGLDGPTANDPGDGDLGANRLQNYPILMSVGVRANTTVHGVLNGNPNRQYRIELFSNVACDASGYGEGETFLGFVDATTDGAGNASFVGTFAPAIPAGRFVTATATDLTTNDTSEFSNCRQAVQAELRVTNLFGQPLSSLTTTESGPASSQFLVSLPSIPTANVTVQFNSSDSTEGTLPGNGPLTFTPTDFSPTRVLVIGVDDGIDDGDVLYTVGSGPASSSDPNYNGLIPTIVQVTNVDNDDVLLQCSPRPSVNVLVTKIGGGRLRATVTVTTHTGQQNEIRSIAWTRLDTATVVLDGVGPVQQGETSTFAPLTLNRTFTIARTPGASSGTVRLTVKDACGDWPTFVGGGPNGW